MASNSPVSGSGTSTAAITSSTPSTTLTTVPSLSITSVSSTSIAITSSIPNSAPSTTTLPAVTSIVTNAPSTTVVAATTPVVPTTIISEVTITTRASQPQNSPSAFITTITSYQSITSVPSASTSSSRNLSASSASTSPSQTALVAGASSSTSSGLSTGAIVAIAVIIPLLALTAGILLGLCLWRRRKRREENAEQVKNDVAEYKYNPNEDPTLPIGVAYTDGGSAADEDSGYRGWGATSVATRKPSTTLGSQGRASAMAGLAMSDGGSQTYYTQPSPSNGPSEAHSEYPLIQNQHPEATDGIIGLGAAAGGAAGLAASRGVRSQRNSMVSGGAGIHRGPSNASSAYSAGGISEASSDIPEVPQRTYYQEEVPYNVYNDVSRHQPYDTNGMEQAVVKDVQARRNTRIERVPTFPSINQGGIAQNF